MPLRTRDTFDDYMYRAGEFYPRGNQLLWGTVTFLVTCLIIVVFVPWYRTSLTSRVTLSLTLFGNAGDIVFALALSIPLALCKVLLELMDALRRSVASL